MLLVEGFVKVFTPTSSVNGSYTISKDSLFCQQQRCFSHDRG
jgi:hypothetical protein